MGWHKLAAETVGKLKTPQADVFLQPALPEAAPNKMDAQTTEMKELQELLEAKSAKLLQLSARHGDMADKLRRVKSQNAAGATVSNDLKSTVEACEHPTNRSKMTSQCKE